jgi:hypothetical protein
LRRVAARKRKVRKREPPPESRTKRKETAAGIANETDGEKKEGGTRFGEVARSPKRVLTGDAAN